MTRILVVVISVVVLLGFQGWTGFGMNNDSGRAGSLAFARTSPSTPADAVLYSPLLKNVGVTVCSAINIGEYPVTISVQIFGHNAAFDGRISGDEVTRPGGWWFAIEHNTTAQFTRGVIRVSGGAPELVRAHCWTSTSLDDPAYFQAEATPLRVNTTPVGANP